MSDRQLDLLIVFPKNPPILQANPHLSNLNEFG